MKVSIQIDAACIEPVVEVHTASVTDEVRSLVKTISQENAPPQLLLAAWKGDFLTMLKPSNIMHIYSGSKKVFVETETDSYELKYRLYEIEEMMKHESFSKFIRISNTDIINFDYVKNFDMSLSGTICVNFHNKKRAFVSRRYIPKIKEWLGIKR
ncbi:MAG: LytTR family transcriptional regulator [Treponema sp.]|nr:LytTR family transcriptional regulator [Treponema sp.]